jgi:hypothetical protein
LLAFGVAIGVLVIVAVVLVLTLPDEDAPLLPEDTPEGIVQRYLLACEDEEYLKAYSYLSASAQAERTYERWTRPIVSGEERPGWKATLGKSEVSGNEATVTVVVDIFRPRRPFEDPVCTTHVTFLLKKEGDSWRITAPNNLYWIY